MNKRGANFKLSLADSEMATGPQAQALIELSEIAKTYATPAGAITAVEAVSFSIGRGETFALLGPSGCGKSTLLMIMGGLLAPSSGRLLIDGRAVDGPRRDLGFVFQRDLLLDWKTVIGNVLLPFELRGGRSPAHREGAQALLARVGLSGFENRRPYELSGGMRQRVAICRALVQNPDILFLDEPFAALDAFTREQMQLDVQRLSVEAPRTTVLVTHEIPEAVFMADRIAVMTARPSRIAEIVDIDLPRPRTGKTRETEQFGRYVTRIHGLFTKLGVLHG